MEVKTYSKLFPAKMAAAKLTKKHGVKYIPVGPSAVDGTYTVELEVPAPAKAKRGLKLGEHIPNGEAAMALLDTKEGLNRINTKGRSVLPDHVGRDFHKPAPRRTPKTAPRQRGFLAAVRKVLKILGI